MGQGIESSGSPEKKSCVDFRAKKKSSIRRFGFEPLDFRFSASSVLRLVLLEIGSRASEEVAASFTGENRTCARRLSSLSTPRPTREYGLGGESKERLELEPQALFFPDESNLCRLQQPIRITHNCLLVNRLEAYRGRQKENPQR